MKNIPMHISTEKALTLTADFRRRTVLRHLMENGDGASTVERSGPLRYHAGDDIEALVRFVEDMFEQSL